MQTYPVLKRSAVIGNAGAGLVHITYLNNEYTLRGDSARMFLDLAERFTGEESVEDIAKRSAYPIDAVTRFVSALGKHRLIAVRSENPIAMPGAEFYDYHRRYCQEWLKEIYDHPFWGKVVNGTASDEQIFGFAFEKYHYIEAAHEHMGIAAANATREMMPHLARHFCEEYTHGDIYRQGLAHIFGDEVVLNSVPLPSTRALVNFLNEAAATSSFSYYAANEFLQMTENDDANDGGLDPVSQFYDKMLEHYPYTKPLIDSFIRHTRLDQQLGHKSAFLEMCKDVPPLMPAQIQDVMETTRAVVDELILFMDGIDTFYTEFPEMPRLPATLLSE